MNKYLLKTAELSEAFVVLFTHSENKISGNKPTKRRKYQFILLQIRCYRGHRIC